MIVFIAPYPDERSERDGMMQRIAAIDAIFAAAPRTYLRVSFWRKRRAVCSRGMITIERVNFFLHHRYILRRLREAKWIFVHSARNAIRILSFLRAFRAKAIIDIHGVAPEEIRFVGKPLRALIYQLVESVMVRDSSLLLFVTHKMQQHFIRKYPHVKNCRAGMILPNFDLRLAREKVAFNRERTSDILRLVYAGGTDKWQNLDLMLRTLDHLATSLRRKWQASIFLPQTAVGEVQSNVDQLRCRDCVEVASLSHDEVIARYNMMDIGFVLRDPTLLNEVAMPTKLVEYLMYGVVPVVLSPELGDLMKYGYKYLTLQDLLEGHKLDHGTLAAMRQSNFEIVASLRTSAEEASNRLARYLGLASSGALS